MVIVWVWKMELGVLVGF
uniref:Uncharacterized protein n=1 Tax=Rhizophora mucronata TaxID=61149 RepID=A0A2P2JKJ8_RHIMU